MKYLFIIPARKGSKGVPNKNTKLMNGKPLISYSIEFAIENSEKMNICISTDDEKVIEIAKTYNIEVPFIRPNELSNDSASTFDVINHALAHYNQLGIYYDGVILLQPTSPYRETALLSDCIKIFTNDIDAVFTVNESKANPYFNLFEENKHGFLQLSKKEFVTRRQDSPKVYEVNGVLYIINVKAMKSYKSFQQFENIRKLVMPKKASIDIDDMDDWDKCELFYKNLDNK